jgi:8-oxoguanine deaminase
VTAPILLIKDAQCIATMDNAHTEWQHASIVIQGPQIIAAGPTHTLPPQLLREASETIDARTTTCTRA